MLNHMPSFPNSSRRTPSRLVRMVLLAAASLGALPLTISAQAPSAKTSAQAPAVASSTPRPYDTSFAKPSFPTTERKQNQFAVEFVYRFFEQTYSPAVAIHVQPKTAAQLDTPEHVLIAQISAATALDYDTWLSLWDTKSQQLFRDDATTSKRDASFWKRMWQRAYQGREITLVKRLETGQYVILEYRIGPPPAAGQPDQLLPAVFKQEGAKWELTRALDDSGFFPAFAGGENLAYAIEFEPVPAFNGQTTNFTEPQQLFFKNEPRGAQSATRMIW